MSSLWTPSGERPVGRPDPPPAPSQQAPPPRAATGAAEISEEELAEHIKAMQAQMLAAPASAVVANQCMALLELAALYLSPQPPKLEDARLAIDAMAAIVEGLGSRLGLNEHPLREALSQIRLAYVEERSRLDQSRPRSEDRAEP